LVGYIFDRTYVSFTLYFVLFIYQTDIAAMEGHVVLLGWATVHEKLFSLDFLPRMKVDQNEHKNMIRWYGKHMRFVVLS
jgi:hypothetical protein